ncbi:hypothetical protein HZB94_04290 [Candidatus Falkowbacteria bacterium]|nr:hypothetical protein [Candidatus Falkowbacteria bacterium]
MTRETIIAELAAMRSQLESTVHKIEGIKDNLCSERQTLRQTIDEYGVKRIELLEEELRARGLTWCTRCSAILPEGKTELLLLEGRKQVSGGYQNSCYGFENFFHLHRACPQCREKAFNDHGTHGEYDALASDQASFFAFRVEQRADGYYAHKFGDWIKLEGEKSKLPKPSSQLVEKIGKEWNLPPQIGFDYRDGDKIKIHEQAATAEAA